MDRPVISFLSDFGPESAPAICRGVMLSIARDAQIVDISHSVRKYAILDGAYLLWSTVPWLPVGTHVVVVDPGVGTARLPIGILTARGDVLIGPDNGILRPAAEVLGGVAQARVLENRDLMLPRTTLTFHGRDIFAPVAAHLAIGQPFATVGPEVALAALVDLEFPAPVVTPGALETTVAYVDSFGNIRLFATPADLTDGFGAVAPGDDLTIGLPGADGTDAVTEPARWARTFGDLPIGAALVYEDSAGLLAIADNQGDAARRLDIQPGRRVRIHSARSRGGG
jgi:S-adenosylmethionine hydrolase